MSITVARFRAASLWVAAAILLCAPGISAAHGLLLDAGSDGAKITGVVYYSNGDLAVRESVELLDLTTPGASPVPAQTDDGGKFSFSAVAGHRYRVSAYGEEGHSVEIELDARVDARPTLVEAEDAGGTPFWPPPAWAVIGGILLLSLIPPLIKRASARAESTPGDNRHT